MNEKYSRNNPSPLYHELILQYIEMHLDAVYKGKTLENHLDIIGRLIHKTQSKSLLDYGSGKGVVYTKRKFGYNKDLDLKTLWGLDNIVLYDPAFLPYSKLPTTTFDAVICTDVLEHCAKQDILWILEEIFSFAKKFVFLSIACYPACKKLPNLQNPHVTVKSPIWWREKISRVWQKYPVYCLTCFEVSDGDEYIEWKND